MNKRTLTTFLLALLLLAAAVPAVLAANGHGPTGTITVTTTDPAANPGDGECALIEAIDNANADADSSGGDCPAGNGADEIVLAPGADYVLTAAHNNTDGGNGLPMIASVVTISGQGATIRRDSAAPPFRLLYVAAGGDLTLHELTVRDGRSDDALGGGGIRNQDGLLTLNHSTVSHNEAAAGTGGGIYTRAAAASATTLISHSDVLSNTAAGGGGGLFVIAGSDVTGTLRIEDSRVNDNDSVEVGGGIRSTSIAAAVNHRTLVTVLRSEVSGNSATDGAGLTLGGGIIASYSELTIVDSVIHGNSVVGPSAHGGGLVTGFSETTILRSTFSGNSTTDTGGGPFLLGGGAILITDGTLTMANSTLAQNSTFGGAGGGALLVANGFGVAPGSAAIANSTIAGNDSDSMAGALLALDAGTGQPVEITLVNTIVADNLAPAAPNCTALGSATITSLGHNLEDLAECGFTQAGDLPGTDPMLGPLLDNGGPTPTMALPAGSPAVEGGDAAACAGPFVDGIDQRGVARPQAATCDIGAYEWRDVPTDVSLSGLSGATGNAGLPAVLALALGVLALVVASFRRMRRS